MRRIAKAVLVVSALCASNTTVQAGLFDFFKSDIAIECPARDADCLFDTALQIDLKNFREREVKQNYAPHAKRAAQLFIASPQIDEATLLKRWADAGADEKFVTEYKRQKRRFGPSELASLEELATIVQNKTTPDGEKLSTYLKRQMPLAFERQGQPARDFWLENLRPIWKNGWSSVLPALSWLAVNDFPVFQTYTEQFKLPEGGADNPYEWLSLDAAALCQSGKEDQGRNILDILEGKARNWPREREKKAMDRAAFTPAMIHCWGEDLANTHINRVLDEMERDLQTAEQKYIDEKERKFVLGIIRSEVAERMIQPMVIWLQNQGREEDARNMFARLPPRAFAMTIGEVTSGDITAAEFPEQEYNELIEFQKDGALYSSQSSIVLEHFVEKWNPTFEICCSEQQQLEYTAEHIAAEWPSELAMKAARKNLDIHKKFVAKDPDDIDDLHQFELELAALEKTLGCTVSDEKLLSYQDAMPAYEYDEQKVEVLIAYLGYLKADQGTATQKDCIIN